MVMFLIASWVQQTVENPNINLYPFASTFDKKAANAHKRLKIFFFFFFADNDITDLIIKIIS